MAAAARQTGSDVPHLPVLLRPLIAAVSPVRGTWLDGTFGAGGYARALLDAGAGRVIAVDRDPLAFEMAREWAGRYGDRLVMRPGVFSRLDEHAAGIAGEAGDDGASGDASGDDSGGRLDGVVLDLGVSSMQLDRPDRGFSFRHDGPLDMRMSQSGPTAADLVNTLPEAALADILFRYGEERASRRIARAIVRARAGGPIATTLRLAGIVESCLPRRKPGQSHPATRTFQALRIAVNDELGELLRGLEAAERALRPGGVLAVVTFHSIEDRMVKRFLLARSGGLGRASRHAPEAPAPAPRFVLAPRRAIVPDAAELAANPRARSARLRIARRTAAPAGPADPDLVGMPQAEGLRQGLRP